MDDPAQENVHTPGEPPIIPPNNRPRNQPRANNNTTPVNIFRICIYLEFFFNICFEFIF